MRGLRGCLVSGLALLVCCQLMEDYQTEKFELSATPATVIGNPVEVLEGSCTGPNGARFPVISGYFLESDWTGSGTAEAVGESHHAAPDSLHLLWFSYAEDKFYEGDFGLPQQRIHALLKQGFWSKSEEQHDTYSDLTICLLPKGGAVVWLAGQNKVLIGRYQGHETSYSFAEFKPGANRLLMAQEERAKLPAEIQEQIRTGTFSPKRWDDYLLTYPWKVEVVQQDGPRQHPLPLYNYGINYLNAERASHPLTEDFTVFFRTLLEASPKAVPQDFILFVTDRYKDKHQIRVDSLDETQTMAAFQALHQHHPKEPIVLRVAVDKPFRRATLTLTNGFQTLPLNKANIKLFEED